MEIPNKIDEGTVQQKKDTLANVSALKQAALPQVSTQVQAQVDPEVSKQQDLDALNYNQYINKYGNDRDADIDYIRNQTQKDKARFDTKQRQELADSQTGLELAADTTLGVASGAANVVGGGAGLGLAAASDPTAVVTEGADFIAGEVAEFVGQQDNYKEAKQGVSDFLDEIGYADEVDNLPVLDRYEGGSISEQLTTNIGNLLGDAAGQVYQGTKAVSDWIKSGQSEALNAKTKIRAQENAEYKQKLKDSLGEDASAWEHALVNTKIGGNAFINLLQDPAAATTVIAESIPSLLGAGSISKSVSGKNFTTALNQEAADITAQVTKENLSHFNTQNLINVKLNDVASDVAKKTSDSSEVGTILASGALEGAGAASEAYNLIIDSDFDTLEKTSKKYQELVKTMTPTEARKQLALQSSLGAGLGVLMLAAGVTKIMNTAPGIERASRINTSTKSGVPRIVEMTWDAGKEGVEEVFQSFIGASATGIVERENIDKDKDVFADAAIAAGEGALAGVGTSGAVSSINLLSDVKGAAKRGIKNKAKPTEKINAIKESGITANDIDVESPGFELNATITGIEERNAVEGIDPNELVSNYYEANNLVNEQLEVLKQKEVEQEKNPSKVLAKEIEQMTASILEASDSTAKMEARLIKLQADKNADKEETPKAAAERTLGNMRSAPDSVSIEQAQSLIDSGSLSESETAQAEAHIQYVRDAKTVAEVNSDILSGGKGFLGIKQYMRLIASSLTADRPESAQEALQKLKVFADRHAQKARDYSEGLAIALNPNATPAEVARLAEINATYPPSAESIKKGFTTNIHKGTPSYVIDKIGTEANALDSAVKLAEINIQGTTPSTTTEEVTQDVSEVNEEVESVPEATETPRVEETPRVSEEQEQTTERPESTGEVAPRETTTAVVEQAETNTINAKEELERVKDSLGNISNIADLVIKAIGDDLVLRVVPANAPELKAQTGTQASGTYHEATGEIYISEDLVEGSDRAEIVLHEVIHSILFDAAVRPKNALEKEFYNNIRKLHSKAKKEFEKGEFPINNPNTQGIIEYALSDIQEFITMGISNPQFMGFLDSIQVSDNRTMLGAFTKYVANLLGITREEGITALEALLKTNLTIIAPKGKAPKETKTVEATPVQETEPVVTEEVDNVQSVVGTDETATDASTDYEGTTPAKRLATFSVENLVKKYFRPKNKTGVTKNPLLSVKDFMSVLVSAPVQMIQRFTEITDVTAKQQQLVTKLEGHHKSFTESLNKVFKPKDDLRGRDMIQYISEDGTIPEFVQTAMSVATYNWIATRAGDTIFNTDEDIRKILGLDPTDEITPSMYEKLRTGGFRGHTAAELGKDILKSIGIESLKTAPGNMQPQLEDSLGLLAIAAMNHQGLVTISRFKSNLVFPDAGSDVKIHKITATTIQGEDYTELHSLLVEYADSVKDTDQLLSKLFSVQAKGKGPLKEPNKNVPKIVRGTAQKISKKYQDIIRKHQARKHFLKREQVEQFLSLSVNTQRAMLGYNFDLGSVQVTRRAAVEGANRAINASINHMMDFLVENNNDEPFYFNHDVIKNGRLLMDSNTFNPQGDKLHRHMMMIEGQESTIDLRSEDPTQLQAFLVAFAQGMGIDVDKQLQQETLVQARKLVDDPIVSAAIQAINNKDGEYTAEQEAAILAGIKKGGEKTWSFDALVAYAAYTKAALDGSELFTHDLMVEADGITNGPGIGTIQFGIGSNKEDKEIRLKKVGININGDTEEFGKWISEPNNRDNYETITLELNKLTEGFTGDDLNVSNLTKFLLGELTIVDDGSGEITKINRNISKNPLMTTIYGAGKKSIKGAIGKATVDALYKFLEDNANNPTELARLNKHMKTAFHITLDVSNPLQLELGAQIEAGIELQVGNVFGDAMLDAIDEQYGQFKEGTVVINEAMGRVAEVFQKMFTDAVERRTNELVEQGVLARGRPTKANPEGALLETLPKSEVDKILADLIESQPIMQSVLSAQNGNATDEGLYVGKVKNVASKEPALQTTQTYNKGVGLELDDGTPYSAGSMFAQVKEYISGGASPVVLAVQNIDATSMLEHLNDNASFNVYDAIITGVDNVEGNTLNINKHFFEINRDHSIAIEAQKAFQRAELAAQKYDKENGTNFRKAFSEDSTRGFGENEVTINVKAELDNTTELTEQARLDTVGLITSSGQYGWENSSHVVDKTNPHNDLIDRSLGNTPESVDGKYETESQEEVNSMNVLDVFDNLTNLGNKLEDLDHRQFLRDSLNTLKSQLVDPIQLHIGDILKHKNAKGEDTLANIEGSDIYMYTQMFGGQKGSTGILNSGLRMSAQEALAHELWHSVSRHGIEGNERAKKELVRRWEQARKVITPFDLMDDPSLGENSPEYAQAQETWNYIFTPRVDKVDVLVNAVTGQTQPKTYSNHLHEFAAYSMTNAKFIEALKQVPAGTKVDQNVREDDGSFLNSLYNKMLDFLGGIVDTLSTHLTNTKGLTEDLAVRELVKQISNIEAQNKNAILSAIDVAGKAAGKLSGMISSTSAFIAKPIVQIAESELVRDSKSAFIRLPGRIVRLRDDHESVAHTFDALTTVKRNLASKKEGFVEQLITEAQGLTDKFKNFHTLSRMKTRMIDGAVVETEAAVMKVLTKAFSDPLTERQSVAITKAFLKTDLSSLNLNQNQLIELLNNPHTLDNQIKAKLAKLAGDPNVNHYIIQAKSLGHMMATGRVTSENQNYNAKQIARLFGTSAVRANAPAGVEKAIDQLATLYALKDTDSSFKITLSELIKLEQAKGAENGMTYLQAFHNKQKEIDLKEVFTGSEVNVVKGHIREEYDPTIQAILLTEADGALYEARGWTKGTELFKDPADPTAAPLYLYVDTHGGQTATITGIISLTSRQARGTDTVKIRQTFGDSSPVYGGAQDATRIHAVKSRNFTNSLSGASTFNAAKASTHMAPLFDLTGQITGYRYLMNDKTKDNVLKRNNDSLRVLANGAASTVNKVNSAELNKKAIEAMKIQFDTVPDSNYIQFGPGSTDPEVRELYRLLPKEAKMDIQNIWGTDTMFVDKKILTMMFGYRKFSVADALAREKQDQHVALQWFGTMLNLLGKPFNLSGEQLARMTGNTWQEFISISKDFIVIKSGIVTAANTISNAVQLFTEGLSPINILKWQKEAAVELGNYRMQRAELFELEKMVELGVQPNQLTQQKARIAQLQADITANPISDVVEDGLLQTIVEDVSLVDDQFTLSGKGKSLLDKYVFTKVPGYVREVANETFQTKESFLYKKMAQSAQLSDFVARYALYKQNINNGMARQDAANTSISTFINYDLPTHRAIQYGNDMGFLWFTKYYIRIQKILITTLVKQPLRVLSTILGDFFSGDAIANMYDSTLSPENVGNRVRSPDNPFEMASNLAVAKVL